MAPFGSEGKIPRGVDRTRRVSPVSLNCDMFELLRNTKVSIERFLQIAIYKSYA